MCKNKFTFKTTCSFKCALLPPVPTSGARLLTRPTQFPAESACLLMTACTLAGPKSPATHTHLTCSHTELINTKALWFSGSHQPGMGGERARFHFYIPKLEPREPWIVLFGCSKRNLQNLSSSVESIRYTFYRLQFSFSFLYQPISSSPLISWFTKYVFTNCLLPRLL